MSNCVYDLDSVPDGVVIANDSNYEEKSLTKWSGVYPIPAIGDPVTVKVNKLGPGTVKSYFVEHGWLGLCVSLSNPPEWKQKQCPPGSKFHNIALVFGKEIES